MQNTNNPSDTPPVWDKESLIQLSEAQGNVPKYLFRAWCSKSGGDSGLNSTNKIVPRAFMFDHTISNLGPDADRSFSALHSQKDFFFAARWHLSKSPNIMTPFSSWTQSINFALRYAMDIKSGKANDWGPADAYLSILDTEALRHTNGICTYHWEYLCYGVIDNPAAHRVVSLKTLLERKLLDLYPEIGNGDYYWKTAGKLNDSIIPLTPQEITSTTELVAPFANLAPAAACALLTTRKRSEDFWNPEVPGSRPDKSVVDQFLNIYGLEGLPDWSTSETIMTERGSQLNYEATWQFRRLMRAIEERKGAMQAHTPTTPSKPDIPMLPITPYTTSKTGKFKAAVSEAMSPFLDDDLDVSAPLGVTPVTPEKTPSKVDKAKAAFVDLVSPKKKK